MSKKRIFTILLGLLLLFLTMIQITAQDKTNPLVFNKITLRVADLQKQSDWYQNTFKFTRKSYRKNKIILKRDSFTLELIGQKDTITTKNLVLPDQMRYLSGFSKFGFVINNLDELFAEIEQQKIETAGGIFLDDKLGFRTFIVKDLEGNLVQFFEPQGILKELHPQNNEWTPAFLMIITDNYQQTIDWYGEILKFKEIGNRDNASRNIFHRTLFNGKVLLELADLPNKVAGKAEYTEIWKRAGGIISVSFSKNQSQKIVFDNNNNLIKLSKK